MDSLTVSWLTGESDYLSVTCPPKNWTKYYVRIREENLQKEAGHRLQGESPDKKLRIWKDAETVCIKIFEKILNFFKALIQHLALLFLTCKNKNLFYQEYIFLKLGQNVLSISEYHHSINTFFRSCKSICPSSWNRLNQKMSAQLPRIVIISTALFRPSQKVAPCT